jgi:hypothetical protein
MNAKHTAPPWRVVPDDNEPGIYYVRTQNNKAVNECEDVANSRLIAAAPELLEALERILYAHDTNNNGAAMGEANLCSFYATMARCAITKAKGEL